MPTDNRTISQLDEVTLATGTPLDASALLEISVTAPSGVVSATGKVSRKITLQNLGEFLCRFVLFSQLATTAKSIVGAINELRGTKLSDTLAAGSTTITFLDASITTSSEIGVKTTNGVWYDDIQVTTGQVELTFTAQASALDVRLTIH